MRYDLVPMDRSHLEGVLAIERACFRQPWSEQVFVDALYNDTVSLIVAQEVALFTVVAAGSAAGIAASSTGQE